MEKPVSAYIALGSNQGKRFEYLQNAVNAIFEDLGSITKVSSVYKTPAQGFEGEEFLNACIEIKTRFYPEQVLEKLLKIEQRLGRVRKPNTETYQNRTLDLDLIFHGQHKLDTKKLILPHPRMQDRKFVLQPLKEIASNFVHPTLNKSISVLLKETKDQSAIEISKEKLKPPSFQLKNMAYLAIEGNIGAGKTSLATMIAQDFNAKLITERFKDNPFLPKFYKSKERYAFPLEMSFLADRYQQLIDDINQYDLFNDFVVADYDIYKSLIFAKITLPKEEFLLYKKLFHIIYKDIAKPNLYLYLFQNTERLLQNIKKRGRTYEQKIPADYLENINRGYLDFIKTQNHLNVKIIDVSEIDFVQNRKDYLYLLQEIKLASSPL